MSVHVDSPTARSVSPEPVFTITGVAHQAFAVAPTLVFAAVATDPSEAQIRSMALNVQVMIDPAKRGYDDDTRARLAELFGPPASWTPSTSGLSWAQVTTGVPGFTGSTTFAIQVPCTYDLEVAAAKYFYAIPGGEVPLSFHFSGNVFFAGPTGALQVVPVAWSNTATFRMPISTWRTMIAEHYPGGGWIRIDDETLAALQRRRSARGLPSFDACVAELLREAGESDG
ncbi:MAG: DUF6084 family protein [Solirubrobacteraceae bacterium]